MVEMDELLAKADFISLHIPLTEQSKHLLNAEMFGKMKQGVRIVDCARGGVIDENALYDAITAGKVAGAALDVFENEPLTDRKLFELPQVIGSPHVGASTKEATARIGDEVADLLIGVSQEPCS
jgi:D-3-phosphoglycerate dehydrogenase